ncbi:hypothetical protein E2542_SST12759 [Spatholobus suberectus]|nr:hypothetical protein E2542_SST12759 [Spatholobus suberectus]
MSEAFHRNHNQILANLDLDAKPTINAVSKPFAVAKRKVDCSDSDGSRSDEDIKNAVKTVSNSKSVPVSKQPVKKLPSIEERNCLLLPASVVLVVGLWQDFTETEMHAVDDAATQCSGS